MPGTEHISQIVNIDVKWKVGIAISSSEVRNLNAPMITMILTTTDEMGERLNREVEMNLSQFKELKATMKQIQSQMENAKLL